MLKVLFLSLNLVDYSLFYLFELLVFRIFELSSLLDERLDIIVKASDCIFVIFDRFLKTSIFCQKLLNLFQYLRIRLRIVVRDILQQRGLTSLLVDFVLLLLKLLFLYFLQSFISVLQKSFSLLLKGGVDEFWLVLTIVVLSRSRVLGNVCQMIS